MMSTLKDFKRARSTIIVLWMLLLCSTSQAFSINSNLFYFSDTLTESSTTTSNHTHYDLDFMIPLTKKGGVQLGWIYSSQSISSKTSSETTYAITEMGPKFSYFFDKSQQWALNFCYFLQSNATSTTSGTTLKWRGSSYKAQFGYLKDVTESFYVGLNLNYHLSSFTEQLTSSNTFSTISYSRAIIYPSIQLTYRN